MSRSLARTARSVVAASLLMVLFAGCGSDEPSEGFATPREVVEAHVQASKGYDLASDCELFTPDRRAQMASFDGDEVDGYCQRATREVIDLADDATRTRTRSIYTDPTVTEVPGTDGTTFTVTATDASYRETVETVEVDGRWWLANVDGESSDE